MSSMIQVRRLPLPGRVLVYICLLLCCSFFHLKLCRCSALGHQDQLNLSSTFDQLPGFLHFLNNGLYYIDGWDRVWGGLGSYIDTYYPNVNSDDPAFFLSRYSMPIRGRSFSVLVTMSIHQSYNLSNPYSSVFFSIQPALPLDDPESYEYPISSILDSTIITTPFYGDDDISGPSYTPTVNVSTGNVSVTILDDGPNDVVWVQVGIQLPGGAGGNSSFSSGSGPANNNNNYSVWIDYDHHADEHGVLSVYVGTGNGTSKPADPIANTTLSSSCAMLANASSLGFLSSVAQLVQLHTLNSTIIVGGHGRRNNSTTPAPECNGGTDSAYFDPAHGETTRNIVLASVLGSAAATAATAAVAYLYFNSRQRRWKKEQDRLTKIMRSLPGVPTQVDFSDIKKATKNFHETTKLGRGGFGAVYRCTLPAAASRTGEPMEVAVKKFTRQVEDRRYDDFLAEVSIINRLRHKNIVPLVGWSYNKGEPLLIYEFMTNGSLDQHLFQRSSTTTSRQRLHQVPPNGTDILQWHTRYEIVRDIATGLHYVHNEHEPMVLHRDIKASNIMLDSNFRARLGDFGIACTVAIDRTSATGIAGTFGYMAPEYVITCRATRQTDTYAFGVLILEIITGNKNADVPADDSHISLWVRRLHREGKLLEAIDSMLSSENQSDNVDEAKRLLLLGLACTNPNPSSRPSMEEVVQVISKVAPPPDVCFEEPMFFGLLEERSSSLTSDSGIADATPKESSPGVVG